MLLNNASHPPRFFGGTGAKFGSLTRLSRCKVSTSTRVTRFSGASFATLLKSCTLSVENTSSVELNIVVYCTQYRLSAPDMWRSVYIRAIPLSEECLKDSLASLVPKIRCDEYLNMVLRAMRVKHRPAMTTTLVVILHNHYRYASSTTMDLRVDHDEEPG